MSTIVLVSENLSEVSIFVPACMKSLIDSSNSEVSKAMSQSLGCIFKHGVMFNCNKPSTAVIDEKKSYDLGSLQGALTSLSPMFQRAPSTLCRGGIAYAAIELLRNSSKSGLLSETNISACITSILSFLAGKCVNSDIEGHQSENCVEEIFKQGLLGPGNMNERLVESTVKSLILILDSLNIFQTRLSLRLLGYLIPRVSSEALLSEIFDPLLPLLSHGNQSVRLYASDTLIPLIKQLPSQATTMVHSIHAIFKSSAADPSEESIPAIHGYGHALAALVHMVPSLNLGIPFKLVDDITTSALYFIDADESDMVVEIGWLLLAAQISTGTLCWTGYRLKDLLERWKDVLGSKITVSGSTSDEIHAVVVSYCSALTAMRSFVWTFETTLKSQSQLLKPIVLLASNARYILFV